MTDQASPRPSPASHRFDRLMIDPSAWLRRYVVDRHHHFVVDVMDDAANWVASGLALPELTLALHYRRGMPGPASADNQLRHDWDRTWEVPVDAMALSAAAGIASQYRLDLNRAVHLSSAQRLPPPVAFLTFDSSQIQPAIDLGFEVISPQ